MCASVRESPASGKSSSVHLRGARRVSTHITDAEVWLIALTQDAGGLAACSSLLSTDEAERAAQFTSLAAKNRFITARAHLRVLLGSALGQSPGSIAFATGRRGKPVLPHHPGLHFNLSHADDLAVIALSKTHEVGVDIENLSRTVDHDALSNKYLSATEQREFARVPDVQRSRHFLKMWTCKEAVAKALGDGLQLPFAQIEVSMQPDGKPQLIAVPAGQIEDWTLHDIDAGRGYAATLALHDEKT